MNKFNQSLIEIIVNLSKIKMADANGKSPDEKTPKADGKKRDKGKKGKRNSRFQEATPGAG